MIYEIWCNGKLHYTRPEGHPDIQEALDLIERTKRLFGVSTYEVRAQQSAHPTPPSTEIILDSGVAYAKRMSKRARKAAGG